MPFGKKNCWEIKRCQREPGGANVAEMGVCPAATDTCYDGINAGKNAGRICWAVAGTCCEGEIQGTFAEKRLSCITCEVYEKVQEEEGGSTSASKLLDFFSKNENSKFVSMVGFKNVKAGERFITQGEQGGEAYIIQRGSCLIMFEKHGSLHRVGYRGRGDIVGEASPMTGEPRSAHVEAETDMELWVLNRDFFENITEDQPELMAFLTELVAARFDSKRPVADRVIGKYIMNDIIGQGEYSIVYKGTQRDLSMPVAIKMMRHDMALRPEFRRNFLNKAKIIPGMNHENIIRVYDVKERFRTFFIIEEYVEGSKLKTMLKRREAIKPSLAVSYVMQICNGLEYAHRLGVVHLGINPNNILVKPDDRLKILDFGLANAIGTEDPGLSGTVSYLTPEQIDGDTVDQRTDIYALGVTAYEMITGKKLLQKGDVASLMRLQRNGDIPNPADINPDLPESLCHFIRKSGRRDPNKRYQSVLEAKNDLLPLVKELGLSEN